MGEGEPPGAPSPLASSGRVLEPGWRRRKRGSHDLAWGSLGGTKPKGAPAFKGLSRSRLRSFAFCRRSGVFDGALSWGPSGDGLPHRAVARTPPGGAPASWSGACSSTSSPTSGSACPARRDACPTTGHAQAPTCVPLVSLSGVGSVAAGPGVTHHPRGQQALIEARGARHAPHHAQQVSCTARARAGGVADVPPVHRVRVHLSAARHGGGSVPRAERRANRHQLVTHHVNRGG